MAMNNNNMQQIANQQQQFPGMNQQIPVMGNQMGNQMGIQIPPNQLMNNQMLGQSIQQGRLQGQQPNSVQLPPNQNNQQHPLGSKMGNQLNTINNLSPHNLPNMPSQVKVEEPLMSQCSSVGSSIQNTNQSITTSTSLTTGVNHLQTPKTESSLSPCTTNVKVEPMSPMNTVKTEDSSLEVKTEVKMEVGSPAIPITSVQTSTSTAVVSSSSTSVVKSEASSPAPPVRQEPKVYKGKNKEIIELK